MNNDENKEVLTKEDYNNIPVLYCKLCKSLRVMQIYGSIDYCDACGNTDIAETDIATWELEYENTYGEKYVTKSNKKTIFNLF